MTIRSQLFTAIIIVKDQDSMYQGCPREIKKLQNIKDLEIRCTMLYIIFGSVAKNSKKV